MADRTSISISKELKERLDDEKTNSSESYEQQIWHLLDLSSNGSEPMDFDELEDRIVSRLARETQADLQSVEESLQNNRDEIMASISAECGDVATTEDIGDLVGLIQKLQQALTDLDVSVDVEQDSDPTMSEDDVETIVERELERTFGDQMQ